MLNNFELHNYRPSIMSSNLKIRPVDDIDRKNLKICGGEPSKAEVHKQKFT